MNTSIAKHQAIHEIKAVREAVPRLSVPAFKRFNLEWARAIQFSLMVECAQIIAESALFREESRGCHYRVDFPQWDTERPPQHTRAKLQGGGPALDRVPVRIDRMKPHNEVL